MSKRKYTKIPKGQPCKPCWELKYCPYGPLVEFFPLLSPDGTDTEDSIKESHREAIDACRDLKNEKELYSAVQFLLYSEPNKWMRVLKYDPEEVSCNVFGHVCPVFVEAEPFTETRDDRLSGRHIPREIMLKVVRRDNQRCQLCGENVPDDEVEFDHLIPYSKGGPTTAHNLRLLCRDCNRKKSDSLSEILWTKPGAGIEAKLEDSERPSGRSPKKTNPGRTKRKTGIK